MSLAATILEELDAEAASTRRLLERLPDAQLGWTPAPKSRTLGQLAMHVATNPGTVTAMAMQDLPELPGFGDVSPDSTAQVLAALDESLASAHALLGGMSDAALAEQWRLRANGRELMALPRYRLLRMVLLNHWYHHRGQLTVYLRLLGVPLPSIYGPTADENPFM